MTIGHHLGQRLFLAQRQEQKLELGFLRRFCSLLEMTNEQLFAHLQRHAGSGKTGAYPMFSVQKVMTVSRHLDVWVKDGFIYEASANYIGYANSSGGKRKNPKVFSSIAWMLQMREKLLKVATGFILRYHHEFFWGNKPIHPISIRKAIDHINGRLEDFFLDRPVDCTMFYRVIKNKMISVEGKEYPMSFFFSRRKVHPDQIKKWLAKMTAERGRLSDIELAKLFSEEFGILIARRTMNKYRKEVEGKKMKIRGSRHDG